MQHTQEPRAVGAARPPLAVRLAIVTALALGIWLGVIILTRQLLGPEMSFAMHAANALGVFVLAVPLAVLARRGLDRRPWSTLGLPGPRPAWRSFLGGATAWLLPAVVGWGACLVLGLAEVRLESPALQLIGAILLLSVLVLVYEAFPEEVLFRGYVYRNLAAAMPPWAAVIAQAALFAVWGTALWVVLNGWDVLVERVILFFGMGAVIGCIRLISGSVWACIGFHTAFQVFMQLLGNGRYAHIEVSGLETLMLATAGLAFLTATTIVGLIWHGQPNWRRPEPDDAVDGR